MLGLLLTAKHGPRILEQVLLPHHLGVLTNRSVQIAASILMHVNHRSD
jgi:hypothetical protein